MALVSLVSKAGFAVEDINGVANVIINSTGNVITPDLTVNGPSQLGNVGNVHITGGSSGQLLSTDGLGNLSWSSGGGGGGFFYVGTRTTPVQITVIMGNLIIGSRSGNIYVPVT